MFSYIYNINAFPGMDNGTIETVTLPSPAASVNALMQLIADKHDMRVSECWADRKGWGGTLRKGKRKLRVIGHNAQLAVKAERA